MDNHVNELMYVTFQRQTQFEPNESCTLEICSIEIEKLASLRKGKHFNLSHCHKVYAVNLNAQPPQNDYQIHYKTNFWKWMKIKFLI